MALPATLTSTNPTQVANANTCDDALRAVSLAMLDIFGLVTATSVAVATSAIGAAGLRILKFQDLAASPATNGFLQRNGSNLEYFNSAARILYAAGGQDVAVADGGTGLSTGTSGGVPAFTGSTTIAASAALTAKRFMVGGGAGAVPAVMGAMTNGQLPVGSTGANPTAAAIAAGDNCAVATGAGTTTWTGTDRAVMFCVQSQTNLALGTNYYAGTSDSGTVETDGAQFCPITGTLVGFYSRGIRGSGNGNVTVTARIAGADTALSHVLAISATETSGFSSGAVAVTKGDLVSVKLWSDASISSPKLRFTLVFQATA